MAEYKYTNRLSHEKSPYLLQHAHNPVDWYPWGSEAFDKARQEDKPVFLSIGYSTCHWCHVMERESFEDEDVAKILNGHFISIKVDREERPDIDHIYMSVCQALTGQGGWPLTIVMNPEREPFFAGTYLPKGDRMGMYGLTTILGKIMDAWKNNREALYYSGARLIEALREDTDLLGENPPVELPAEAFNHFKYTFDNTYGGFGRAPKFPSPHNLFFLLRYWYIHREELALEMVEKTLASMHRGGIYDHVGFGFSRYSTDKKWLVPHFEKMLYDNALLAIAYLEAFQATRKEEYARVAKEIFTYVLRDMTSQEGGFYSAEDADSEGVEGKFYVWTPGEIKEVLGEEAGKKYCSLYDITDPGNFEGHSIPNLIKSGMQDGDREFAEECRRLLFDHREKRIHPYKDDKILTAWNGLMIAAMAMGGRILKEESYTRAAENAVKFIDSHLIRNDGRLMARYRQGEAAYPAYADDYAFLVWGLLELYVTTYRPQYLVKALKLNGDLLKYFWDHENGGLFIYGSDGEQLIARPKEAYDGAMPSGNSVCAMNFLRLARLTGQHELEDKALQLFRAFGTSLERVPYGHAFMLTALLFSRSAAKEIVIVGDEMSEATNDMLKVINDNFRPFTTSILHSGYDSELLEAVPYVGEYHALDGKPSVYICENFLCQAPVTDIDQLRKILEV